MADKQPLSVFERVMAREPDFLLHPMIMTTTALFFENDLFFRTMYAKIIIIIACRYIVIFYDMCTIYDVKTTEAMSPTLL